MTREDGDRTLQRLRSYSTGNQKWVDYFNFAQPFCVCRQSELSTNHCVHFTFLGYLIPLCVNMHRAGLISPYYFIYLRGKPIIVQPNTRVLWVWLASEYSRHYTLQMRLLPRELILKGPRVVIELGENEKSPADSTPVKAWIRILLLDNQQSRFGISPFVNRKMLLLFFHITSCHFYSKGKNPSLCADSNLHNFLSHQPMCACVVWISLLVSVILLKKIDKYHNRLQVFCRFIVCIHTLWWGQNITET